MCGIKSIKVFGEKKYKKNMQILVSLSDSRTQQCTFTEIKQNVMPLI